MRSAPAVLERVTPRESLPVATGGGVSGVRGWLELAAVLGAFLVWAGPVTHGAGGRGPWLVAIGLLSLIPALALLRPWRTIPLAHTLLAMSPALAATVVCLVSPTRWDGLDEVATYVYAGAAYLVVRSWSGSSLRRHILLAGLALAGLEQFTQAYLPWWGGGDVSRPMLGTFFWHNQFSIFMVATGVVAGVLAVRGTGAVRLTGLLVAPWCLAALPFAGSRAGLATFAVVWVVLIVLSFRDRRGRVAVLGLLALALALASLLSSPLLMDSSGSASSTLQSRQQAQSAESNGLARATFAKVAVELGARHPLTGAGFDSFGGAGAGRTPSGFMNSIYAHNGYLQAFSDGGLVLLAAVTAATTAPLLCGLRLMLSRRRRGADDVVACAVPAALLALVLHSGVDFDWAYPSLVVLFALLAGLLPTLAKPPRQSRSRVRAGAVLVAVLVIGAVPGSLRATGLHAASIESPTWVRFATLGLPLHGTLGWLPSASTCADNLDGPSVQAARRALACTAPAAEDNPTLAVRRALTMVRLGQRAEGRRVAAEVVAASGERLPALRLSYAELLMDAKRWDEADRVLRALRLDLVAAGRDSLVTEVDRASARLQARAR